MNPTTLNQDLYQFAAFPKGWDDFRTLVTVAKTESWAFKRPAEGIQFYDIDILVYYLMEVFRRAVIKTNTASDFQTAGRYLLMKNGIACFHTGLYTQGDEAIYMLFGKNDRANAKRPWIFKRYVWGNDPALDAAMPRPEYPAYRSAELYKEFDPYSQVYIDFHAVTAGLERQGNVPSRLCDPNEMRQLLIKSVDKGRHRAKGKPNYAPLIAQTRGMKFILPVYVTQEEMLEWVIVLEAGQNNGYLAQKLLPVKQAYLEARLVGPIKTGWLYHMAFSEHGFRLQFDNHQQHGGVAYA